MSALTDVTVRAMEDDEREMYEHRLALTRRLVEGSMRSADRRGERAERREQRLERRGERLERARDENSQALRALRDSLTGGNGPRA